MGLCKTFRNQSGLVPLYCTIYLTFNCINPFAPNNLFLSRKFHHIPHVEDSIHIVMEEGFVFNLNRKTRLGDRILANSYYFVS